MARGKKDRVVDTIVHKSGLRVDILFNPNPGDADGLSFSASIGDKRFVNSDASLLKREIYAYLNAQVSMTWHPVIVVTEVAPFDPGRASFVGLFIERCYMTNGADGHVRELRWDDYAAETDSAFSRHSDESVDSWRLSHARTIHYGLGTIPECLPYLVKGTSRDRQVRVLAYDEALYVGLMELDNGIARLRDKLRDMLGSPDGHAKIIGIGEQLLKMLPETVDENP